MPLDFRDVGETSIGAFSQQLRLESELTQVTAVRTYFAHQVDSVDRHARSVKHERLVAFDMLSQVT
jgi:hypothetical protein